MNDFFHYFQIRCDEVVENLFIYKINCNLLKHIFGDFLIIDVKSLVSKCIHNFSNNTIINDVAILESINKYCLLKLTH